MITIDLEARSISISDINVTLLFERPAQRLAFFGVALIAYEQERARREGSAVPHVAFSKIELRYTRMADELRQGPRDRKKMADYFYRIWLQHLASHQKEPAYKNVYENIYTTHGLSRRTIRCVIAR